MAWLKCQCGAEIYVGARDERRCPVCHLDLASREGTVRGEARDVVDSAVASKGDTADTVTTELPPLTYQIPEDLGSILSSSPSTQGYSAVSSYLTCPERSRLWASGLRRKTRKLEGAIHSLDAKGYGSLIHTLLAIRVVHGTEVMGQALEWYGQRMTIEDRTKAYNLIMTYDSVYPLDAEPFKYLGVEVDVFTEVNEGIVRSVRYDALVQYPGQGVASLEHKTSSRAGRAALEVYFGQFYTQMAVWNMNKPLVDKYGPMLCIIGDQLVKTVTPQVERHSVPFGKHHLKLVREYLSLPDSVRFPKNPDGSYPKMLHACWGKFEPCPFIGLCHEDLQNDYERSGSRPDPGTV